MSSVRFVKSSKLVRNSNEFPQSHAWFRSCDRFPPLPSTPPRDPPKYMELRGSIKAKHFSKAGPHPRLSWDELEYLYPGPTPFPQPVRLPVIAPLLHTCRESLLEMLNTGRSREHIIYKTFDVSGPNKRKRKKRVCMSFDIEKEDVVFGMAHYGTRHRCSGLFMSEANTSRFVVI
jgi:hypothetical protein